MKYDHLMILLSSCICGSVVAAVSMPDENNDPVPIQYRASEARIVSGSGGTELLAPGDAGGMVIINLDDLMSRPIKFQKNIGMKLFMDFTQDTNHGLVSLIRSGTRFDNPSVVRTTIDGVVIWYHDINLVKPPDFAGWHGLIEANESRSILAIRSMSMDPDESVVMFYVIEHDTGDVIYEEKITIKYLSSMVLLPDGKSAVVFGSDFAEKIIFDQ